MKKIEGTIMIECDVCWKVRAGTKLTTSFEYGLPYSVFGKLIDKLRVHKAMEKESEKAL